MAQYKSINGKGQQFLKFCGNVKSPVALHWNDPGFDPNIKLATFAPIICCSLWHKAGNRYIIQNYDSAE